MQAFRSDIVQCDDEFDHLGLYLNHNHYSTYAEELKGDSEAQINFTGYRSEIDRFFSKRLLDSNTPCPLKQDKPAGSLWIAGSCSQNAFNEAFKERFAPFSHVMHEFKKAQI